jgi:hypothetical protein
LGLPHIMRRSICSITVLKDDNFSTASNHNRSMNEIDYHLKRSWLLLRSFFTIPFLAATGLLRSNSLVFFEVVEDLFLFLDLPAIVLRLFVGNLNLELEVVEFLLLPLDLHAQLDVFLLQVLALVLQSLIDGLLGLGLLIVECAQPRGAGESADELLALLCEHLELQLLVDLVVDGLLIGVVELGYADLVLHMFELYTIT